MRQGISLVRTWSIETHACETNSFNIDLIVNIILDYLKKTVHKLFTLPQIRKEVVSCKRSPMKVLNMNSFTRISQSFR